MIGAILASCSESGLTWPDVVTLTVPVLCWTFYVMKKRGLL